MQGRQESANFLAHTNGRHTMRLPSPIDLLL